MGSAKQQAAITNIMALLSEWDKGNKTTRKKILAEFVAQNQNKTGPELEGEFAQAASLFLTRLTAWLRLTYMVGTCLHEQLEAITIFVAASSGHKFLSEFLEVGGILTLLEIIGLKQAHEADKAQALRLIQVVANAGRKYKELICESYGIRAIAECLANSMSYDTQELAKNLLLSLAEGNPKFVSQVYKGLIALLPCSSPHAKQLAAQSLQTVQPIVQTTHPSIVEPVLGALGTLHLEVQFEVIELIKLLMDYDTRERLVEGLVRLLKPNKAAILAARKQDIFQGDDNKELKSTPLPLYIQQAAAAKTVGILAQESMELAEQFIQSRVTHNLMVAMGNQDSADSQRQASVALEILCRSFPVIDQHVRDAMGGQLYDQFVTNPEGLYVNLTAVQADVLSSNKVDVVAGGTLAIQ